MVDEKYLKMAITIKRTYLKLINNLDLYRDRASEVANRLDDTIKKVKDIQDELSKKDPKSQNISEKEIYGKLFKILDEVEEEGKRLENLVNPINIEIEKLAKEEQELYRQILEHHPNLTQDQIVSSVSDRLIKEGLS